MPILNQSGAHCNDLYWLNNASQLLICHRLKQQEAKINKQWKVSAFEQAKEVARRAVEESKEMDRKLKELVNQIEAQGHTIVWESPKQGIFLPYIVNAEGKPDYILSFISFPNANWWKGGPSPGLLTAALLPRSFLAQITSLCNDFRTF